MFLFYFACNCLFDCVLDMENAVFLGHMCVKCPRIVQKIKKESGIYSFLDIVIEKVVFLPNLLPEIFQFWIWTYSPQLPKICPNARSFLNVSRELDI